jgi:hypothetical protein
MIIRFINYTKIKSDKISREGASWRWLSGSTGSHNASYNSTRNSLLRCYSAEVDQKVLSVVSSRGKPFTHRKLLMSSGVMADEMGYLGKGDGGQDSLPLAHNKFH